MGNMPEVWFPNLGISIMHLERVAFTVFGKPIYWYGIIIGTGVILATLLAFAEAKRTKQNPEDYLDLAMWGMLFALIGARLYYVLFTWDSFKDNIMDIFAIRMGGLAIYGGIIAGILTAIVFAKRRKLNFWLIADTAAPCVLLGQMLGRWGNFFNREAFGGYTDGLFAMRYLKDQVSPVPQAVLDHIVTVNGAEYIQVQPTFLYESLWSLGILIILLIMLRRKKFHGQIFSLYLFGYACGRVWIEGLRTDQLLVGQIPVSQALSAIIILLSFVIFWYCRNRQNIAVSIKGEDENELAK